MELQMNSVQILNFVKYLLLRYSSYAAASPMLPARAQMKHVMVAMLLSPISFSVINVFVIGFCVTIKRVICGWFKTLKYFYL